MTDPAEVDPAEQAEFRRRLRALTRPRTEVPDDEDWKPHPTWDFGGVVTVGDEPRRHGPPPMPNPSPQVLAVRRYRERLRERKLAEG